MVGVEKKVLVCVVGFSVDLDVQATVSFDVHSTVQWGQISSSDIFMGEFDVFVNIVDINILFWSILVKISVWFINLILKFS